MVKQYALATERYLFGRRAVISQDFLFNASTMYQLLTIASRLLLLLIATPFILLEMVYLRLSGHKIRPSWSFPFELVVTFVRLLFRAAIIIRPPTIIESDAVRLLSIRPNWYLNIINVKIEALWLDPRPDMLAADSVHPDVPPEKVPCFWFRHGTKEQRRQKLDSAAGSNENVVLYFVGGGYMATSPVYFSTAWNISKATSTRVLAINYRKAIGEKRQAFPAALQDALAGYAHLLDLGFKPQNISVMGDSAGGGLTMTLCLHLRDRKLPIPRSMVLISPWCDLTMSLGKSLRTNESTDYLCQEMCRTGCTLYGLNDPKLLKSPLLSPSISATGPCTHRGKPYDLKGLPRVLILAGEAEVLLDEISMLAEAVRRDNGYEKVQYVVEPDAIHVYPCFDYIPEAKGAIATVGEFAFS